MKRIFFICIVFLSFETNAIHQKLSLKKALELKYVKSSATSLGGHSGLCMKMNIKNLINDSILIIVEAGRRLNSIDEQNQDILITKEEIIALKKYEDKWIVVKGYCCQANNHSPSANAKYDVNTLADSNLAALARYLSKNPFDMNVEQQAIWAISDLKPTAQITTNNDSTILPLRQLVSNLKGEPLPWYTIISKTYVYASGTMETIPLWLRGKLNYATNQDCYVTLHVLNSKGMEVCQIINQWALSGKNHVFSLNLPVKGLAKGKYTIEVASPEKQLVRKEFEI